VSSIIQKGYIIKWKNNIPPPSMWHPNRPNAYKHPDFVTSQINIVKNLGVIEECRREDLLCILGMDVESKSAGKMRLIINGHPLV
jgi:hypothetical protein